LHANPIYRLCAACHTDVTGTAYRAEVIHPRALTPSARALYWYLVAVGWNSVEVKAAAAQSGIPDKTIYEAIRNFPDVFRLRGSCVEPNTTPPAVLP
jgi:hypothetical protein